MRALVGLTGRRASGKTTIALQLKSTYGYAHASFGDFVRLEAKRRGLPQDTSSLQTLGDDLIDQLGWEKLCRDVLGNATNAEIAVVDGIRHKAALSSLRAIAFPGRFVLVFIDIDNRIGAARLVQRSRIGDESADEMTTELEDLRRNADLIVDGASDGASATIAAWITQHM